MAGSRLLHLTSQFSEDDQVDKLSQQRMSLVEISLALPAQHSNIFISVL